MFNLGDFRAESKKDSIYKKYPRFLKNCYISVGDGWLPIVEDLCEKIEQVYQNLSPEEKAEADRVGNYKGCQFKEKSIARESILL